MERTFSRFQRPRANLFEDRSVHDVFSPVWANYKFFGASILPTFSSQDIYKAPEIEADTERLKPHLKATLKL